MMTRSVCVKYTLGWTHDTRLWRHMTEYLAQFLVIRSHSRVFITEAFFAVIFVECTSYPRPTCNLHVCHVFVALCGSLWPLPRGNIE